MGRQQRARAPLLGRDDLVQNVLNINDTSNTGALDSSDSPDDELPLWRDLPSPVKDIGRRIIDMGRGAAYRALFKLEVKGKENIPHNEQVIVIANHTSHLDIGLIKESLGSYGHDLCVLAAQDYFFDDEYKDALFGQFTRLIPIDRFRRYPL